jgi:hypothetical protein
MANIAYSISVSGGSQSLGSQKVRTADGTVDVSPTLQPGKAGTLSTRTDDDTGVITATAHGLSVSDVVDVYWSGGRRYGMIVSSVADANNVTVGTAGGDVGAGDAFPIATTAVVITERVQVSRLTATRFPSSRSSSNTPTRVRPARATQVSRT